MPAPRNQPPPTKRAPQQQRALERIEAILGATRAVLARDGYEGLTMVKIAAQAGITHTSIYHYFTSVEAILTTLVSQLMHDFDQQVDAIVARAETPLELVEALLEGIELGFNMYRSNPVARGLWAATRYLPALRKIDDEDSANNAQRFSDRFATLMPDCDRGAITTTTLLATSLAVPAYEVALTLDRNLQDRAIHDFLEMVRLRLLAVLAAPGN